MNGEVKFLVKIQRRNFFIFFFWGGGGGGRVGEVRVDVKERVL